MSIELQKQESEAAKLKKRERMQRYYILNRERILKRTKAYQATRRDVYNQRSKRHYESNLGYYEAYGRRYYQENRESMLAAGRKWYSANREKLKATRRRWRQKNRAAEKAYAKEYFQTHKEKCQQTANKWRAKNLEKARAYVRKYSRKRYSTPKGKLDHRMANAIWQVLKKEKGGRSWKTLVGYSVEDLKIRIESQFSKGMTWELYMSGDIEIDHIIPIVKFSYTKPEDQQFRQCWALDNLRPMWKPDNRRKKDRLEKHEQVPLGI